MIVAGTMDGVQLVVVYYCLVGLKAIADALRELVWMLEKMLSNFNTFLYTKILTCVLKFDFSVCLIVYSIFLLIFHLETSTFHKKQVVWFTCATVQYIRRLGQSNLEYLNIYGYLTYFNRKKLGLPYFLVIMQ